MKYLEKLERVIVLSLLVMMVSVVFLSTIELGWIIIKDILYFCSILMNYWTYSACFCWC
jgi:hypothetical protein